MKKGRISWEKLVCDDEQEIIMQYYQKSNLKIKQKGKKNCTFY